MRHAVTAWITPTIDDDSIFPILKKKTTSNIFPILENNQLPVMNVKINFVQIYDS